MSSTVQWRIAAIVLGCDRAHQLVVRRSRTPPTTVSMRRLSVVRSRPWPSAWRSTSGSQISPPVWSRPRIVKMKLSSPPTLLKPAEDPRGHRDDVAGMADQLAVDRVASPAEHVGAAGDDEHLGREVHVQRVVDAGRHRRAAELEAVRDGEVDELLGLRHARADDRVVELALGARRAAVDEGVLRGDEVGAPDRAAGDLVGGDAGGRCSRHQTRSVAWLASRLHTYVAAVPECGRPLVRRRCGDRHEPRRGPLGRRVAGDRVARPAATTPA